jgi:hypothetical protein
MTKPSEHPEERSTVVLRSHVFGAAEDAHGPLADEGVRRIVVASAEALAERNGVRLARTETTPASLTLTILGPALVAVGFAAELRRATEAWHRSKYGSPLWSEGDGR